MNPKTRSTIKTIAAAVSLASLGEIAQAAQLEEVLVTAQKREQSLQDVPIAIAAVDGESMRRGDISRLENLAPTIPSFSVSEGFGLDGVFLRGLGSGINFGFEQAVGQVIDGYFYGRSRFGRVQFLDIERVEVLKGPQGALLGKNTTAGAINITTAKPTQEFEAWVTGNAHLEGTEGFSTEGAVSGPITDSLSARLALRYEKTDGYMDNVQTGNDEQEIDDIAGRFSLLYEPSDTFSALFSWTEADYDRHGRTLDVRLCDAGYLGFLERNGVSEPNCEEDYKRNADSLRAGVADESNDTEISAYTLTLNWEFDGFTLTSLTGYAEYEYLEKGDNDRSPVEFIGSDLGEDWQQTSQELRLVSDLKGEVDWIAGIYYQDTEQTTLFNLHVNTQPLNGGTLAANRHILTDQNAEAWSLFGQVGWQLTPGWKVSVDARYTDEEKDAVQEQYPTAIYDDQSRIPGPGAGGPAGVFNEHVVIGDRGEDDVSGGLVLQWNPDEGDNMFYASLKTGFKGGGFDHNLSAGTNIPQAEIEDRFEYDDESVIGAELGGKLTLADGAANLNFAVFYSEYDDLQVSTLTGPGTFNVGNAASATTQGIEVDGNWQATDQLRLSFSAAYLDATYDDFVDAPCSEFQKGNNPSGAVTCPDPVNGTQDLSGKELQNAPEWSYALSGEYLFKLTDNLDLEAYVMVYGQDETALALDLDPNTIEDAYTKVDARLTLQSAGQDWEVSLVGRNLTDETVAGWANDFPVFVGSYWSVLHPPRTVTLQGTIRF
jgi:outer membrane receptor protein involved in Fe transport